MARKRSKNTPGKKLFGQLVHELGHSDETGKFYGDALRKPDPDRSLLLTAHIIVERLIESMLETRLPHPEFWLPNAEFDSKVRLARALGLIVEQEHRACSVLNSARNALAHKLEPLPQKWRVELKRLASVVKVPQTDEDPDDFYGILRKVVAIVFGRRNHMLFHHRRARLRDEHGQRWLEIVKQKIDEAFMSGEFDEELINLQVDLQIAREVKQRKT